MGQKVHPIGLRLGITEDWRSRWFATKDFAKDLEEDLELRRVIEARLARAGISRIEVERAGDRIRIDIHTARPGIVIGKKGAEVDALRADIEKRTGKQVQINIQEIKRPETDATLIAHNLAEQLEARVSFRRAMKKAVTSALKSGAKGIKVMCSGRLGGSEMARREWYREGRVPLHTLRATIDYGFTEARTTFGRIGVKVWVYKGEVLPGKAEERPERQAPRRAPRPKPEVQTAPVERIKDAIPEEVASEVSAALAESLEQAQPAPVDEKDEQPTDIPTTAVVAELDLTAKEPEAEPVHPLDKEPAEEAADVVTDLEKPEPETVSKLERAESREDIEGRVAIDAKPKAAPKKPKAAKEKAEAKPEAKAETKPKAAAKPKTAKAKAEEPKAAKAKAEKPKASKAKAEKPKPEAEEKPKAKKTTRTAKKKEEPEA
ncbi:MAG: 30S ribosomal protein S3 [Actinobacteria bacterium]|nr:MAG: 30S ribosomal protein S3 [Actinomycetota bacterium]